ncbi:tyrosine-protein phosphatase [Anaerosphaera multitolerans]|uniref:Tyrosine-protein phosphatase n=1 Tax=Anaerosphaera multitolerans TaxID=2487351 RepID=A0A437S7T8_9FIRM|nr:tyrosine-protein phosphatase [Anaerosphaera multitolerans]RVU55133.1 tyrosine-protein phosphatase [Anaerosphaera multitolerans]
MKSRILKIEGVRNVRDLGGIENRDGKILKRGFYFRTGSLYNITDKGQKTLVTLGIDTVIDLRSRVEVDKKPDKVTVKNHYWMPMLDAFQAEMLKGTPPKTALNEMYMSLIRGQEAEFRNIFKLIADHSNGKGILYHCTAGKDRTGILSMLLLSAANVSYDKIIEDYSMTYPSKEVLEKYPEHLRFLFYAPPEAMDYTLKWIDVNYGGPLGYLNKIGVVEKELDIIRNSFGVL